ncbi:MAG: 30S ribosomal protein S6 [Dehalococcoidia bacterium]
MNEYEMMTVFHPRLSADETTAAIASLEEQIAANGGEMLSTDNWGRRRLAYPIDGVVDGTYVLMTFKMPPAGAVPLERWIRISESTLRHLLIRGIIPFEGGRDDRDRDRDDRDRDDRDDRDEDDDTGSDEPRAAAPAPAVEAADTSSEENAAEASAAGEADASSENED